MKRVKLFIKYFKNTRILDYEIIIQKALDKKYEIISLRDYIEGNYNKRRKLLLLRHDIDHLSDGTRMMFEVEKKYKVTSSFYFRNCTFTPTLMKDIEVYGSESSLHFESIADFVKANSLIKTKEELFKTDFHERCLKLLKLNIERFRLLIDAPCITIASHGEYENRLVKTPNNYLTESKDTYQELGIKLEAYNKEFIDKVTSYISDAPIEVNNGYRYGMDPIEKIDKEDPMILLLTHPNHWHYNRWKQFKKMVKVIIKKPINKKESFKRV